MLAVILRVWIALATQPVQSVDEYRGAYEAGLWSDLQVCMPLSGDAASQCFRARGL